MASPALVKIGSGCRICTYDLPGYAAKGGKSSPIVGLFYLLALP
jgi:hypothetical protein